MENIDKSIERLSSQVNKYRLEGNADSSLFLSSFKLSKAQYIGIPLSIFILLLVFQPRFVKVEDIRTGVLITSYKKILIMTLTFSMILIIGIYGHNYRKVS